MQEIFEEAVRDVYNAEKQLLKALPKLIKSAQNPRLKEALQHHLGETEEHARRVEEACMSMGIRPAGVLCKGMKGLIDETNEHLQGKRPSPMTDAEIIASAQKSEHYEIATYGTICEWAKMLGQDQALNLFKQNLSEEEMADQTLTQIAEGEVNREAAQEGQRMMAMGRGRSNGQSRSGSRRSSSRGGNRKRSSGRSASSRVRSSSSRGRRSSRAKASTR